MNRICDYLPFWKDLSEDQRPAPKLGRERSYKRRNSSRRLEDCVGLVLVKRGQLRVYTVSDEGKELTLYRLFERDMCLFSASCVLPSVQFDIMVLAEADSEVYMIPPLLYRTLMDSSIAVANYTNELMASHFSEVMWLMDKIMNKKLDSRLAAFLLEERELVGSDTIKITHEQIANHLGSIREVVTRVLNYLCSEGMVRLGRGSILLTDLKRLAELAESSRR